MTIFVLPTRDTALFGQNYFSIWTEDFIPAHQRCILFSLFPAFNICSRHLHLHRSSFYIRELPFNTAGEEGGVRIFRGRGGTRLYYFFDQWGVLKKNSDHNWANIFDKCYKKVVVIYKIWARGGGGWIFYMLEERWIFFACVKGDCIFFWVADHISPPPPPVLNGHSLNSVKVFTSLA